MRKALKSEGASNLTHFYGFHDVDLEFVVLVAAKNGYLVQPKPQSAMEFVLLREEELPHDDAL